MPKIHPFMSDAFRPFFLLNGLFTIVVMSTWLMALHGAGPAAVARVLSPLNSGLYLEMIDLSALGWIVTFAIFTAVYFPVLTRPRVE